MSTKIRVNGFLTKHSSMILSSLAAAGVVATAALAVRATPAAMKKLSDAKALKTVREPANAEKPMNELDEVELTRVEMTKAVWREYLPAGISGVATVACIFGAHQIGIRRAASLLSAYQLVDSAFSQYKDVVLEQLGKNKELKVREEVQSRELNANPVSSSQVIVVAGGDQLCYDSLTGRYFKSDVESIRGAELEIKQRILTQMYAGHNEFYELLGLAPVGLGDELGWNIENLIELVFTSHIADDGRPCLAIGYVRLPRVDYGKF